MVSPFKHAYATGYRIRYTPAPTGGLVANTLIVQTNLAMEPGSATNYSPDKVNSLLTAAASYAKAREIPFVEFER